MTRVNCIPVEHLSNKHLVAEWHEMPRVVTMVEKQIANEGQIKIPPNTYRMGTGHMQFFADKLGYVSWRMLRIRNEMKLRGYDARPYVLDRLKSRIQSLPKYLNNQWYPDAYDMETNLIRLQKRDPEHYNGMNVKSFLKIPTNPFFTPSVGT